MIPGLGSMPTSMFDRPGSAAYNSGSTSIRVPKYKHFFKVIIWGAGGGGGSGGSQSSEGQPGQAGGLSTFAGLIANGGGGGARGRSDDSNGGTGANGYPGTASGGDINTTGGGNAGGTRGAGVSGGTAGGNGGRGGYVEKTYGPGELRPGSIQYLVLGAGGQGGSSFASTAGNGADATAETSWG